MHNDLNIIALIPARSGSKSIIDKNIQSIKGKPMLVYSIEHGLQSKYIKRTIVSTDSQYYADIAAAAGAEVPFLRPKDIAQDKSLDIEVFEHAIKWLNKNENYHPDIIVHLRPTTPIRNVADIDAMIELLLNNPNADSVRSVSKNPETPFKTWFMEPESKQLIPVIEKSVYIEPYNMPRQALRQSYLQNASVDVIRTSTITEKKSMTGSLILGYEMAENYDIDYQEQLAKIPFVNSDESKTLVVDIDGVIALLSPKNDYSLAEPNLTVIKKVNELYDKGNYIVLFTARGSKTGIDWSGVTKNQLQLWGVKYHELKFGKPFADYYIDDRLLSVTDLLNL